MLVKSNLIVFAFLLTASLLIGVSGAEASDLEDARARAEIYSQRSDEAAKKPPRAYTPEELKAKELMKQADEVIISSQDTAEIEKAMESYEKAIAVAPDFEEPWWKLGRACFSLAQAVATAEEDPKEKMLEIYARGKQACSRAIEIDPASPGANYWLANLVLCEAGLKGALASAWVLPEVFRLTDKVAEVDPYYDYGAVFRTYGVVFLSVPGWLAKSFGYSPDIILPYLDKAIEREPACFSNYIVRSQIYDRLGRRDDALSDLDYPLSHDPAALKGWERDNRVMQKQAYELWIDMTGRLYPER